MNVLIIGKNERNKTLEQELSKQGAGVQMLPSLEDVLRLKGCPGAFEVTSKEGDVQAEGILFTEAPALEAVLIGEAETLGLTNPDLMATLEAADSNIVFLLDYCSETPEYLTAKALKYALDLAGQNKQVVFLSRFVKTSSDGVEEIYRKARQAGVTFIKYEGIDCGFQEEAFVVNVFDGVFTTEISTKALVAAGKEVGNAEAIRTFRLAKTNGGYVNGNKFFLDPVATSRKGVFYLNPNLREVREMVPYIISELRALADEPVSYAEVEAEKCAFCYSCYRVCVHGALEPDMENDAMKCVDVACFGCGNCAAICPGQAITMQGETASPEKSGNRKVFCCENLGLPMETIPCGGRVGQDWIAVALADYDEVLVAVCADDACRHMVGGKRSCQLTEAIGKLEIPDKKIACVKASHAMKHVLSEFLQEGVD